MERYWSKEASFPIFDAKQLKDKIVLSGGGGGQHFGVPNQLCVVSANSLEVVHSLDTKTTIFERLLVSELDDLVIAISEKSITLFSINPAGRLIQEDSTQLAENVSGYALLAEQLEGKLFVYNHAKKFLIFETKGHRLVRIFESELQEPVLAFCPHHSPAKMIFVLADRINVFDSQEKRFVQTSFEFSQQVRKAQCFYTEGGEYFVVLRVEQTGSICLVFKKSKSHPLSLELVNQQKLVDKQVTAFDYKERNLALATVEGQILVFYFSELAKFIRIYEKVVHQLPARSIILRRMPTTYEDPTKLMLLSFGIDYKMCGYTVARKTPSLGINWSRVLSVMIFLVFLTAVIIALLKQNSHPRLLPAPTISETLSKAAQNLTS